MRQTDRQTDRQTETERQGHRDTYVETETDRQRQTDRQKQSLSPLLMVSELRSCISGAELSKREIDRQTETE